MKESISPQRKWQLRKKAEGNCIQCGMHSEDGTVWCRTCRKKFNEKRKLANYWASQNHRELSEPSKAI